MATSKAQLDYNFGWIELNFRFINSVTDKFTDSASLGCAVFSSVLVSSRMHSILYAVSFERVLILLKVG